MRELIRPKVLESALVAGAGTALACLPRLLVWNQPMPVWVLLTLIFLCSVILWCAVFGWHTLYSGRPVLVTRPDPKLLLLATGIGIFAAVSSSWWLDPTCRTLNPADYPRTFMHWLAAMLFALSFTQLFLVFAPLAWLLRLTRNTTFSAGLTCMVGVMVLLMKLNSLHLPLSPPFLSLLVLMRVAFWVCLVLLYLRGGLLLTWWCGFLIESRHLFHLSEL